MDDYVPAQELMDMFHISKRTVYYDIKKINSWLGSNQLGPVEYVRGTGFILPKSSRAELPAKVKSVKFTHYYLSRNKRKAWLAIHLLIHDKPMFLIDMEKLLWVSRGTAHVELKNLQKQLAQFGLKICYDRKQGYSVLGNEKDQRVAICHFIAELFVDISWKQFVTRIQGSINESLYAEQFFTQQYAKMSDIYEILVQGEKLIGMELTDETIVHFAVRFLCYTSRISQGKIVAIDTEEKEALQATPQYKAAQSIANDLGKLFHITFPEDEVCYIAIHLLTAKINKLEIDPNNIETLQLHHAVKQMIDQFERVGCVFFHNHTDLEQQLLLHVKSAFYRIKYGLSTENPLVDLLIEKYRDVFEITQRSVGPLEELLHRRLNIHEVSYLAMHFGGWLRREQVAWMTRKIAAIVCVNGVSASRMVKIQLEQLFPSIDFTILLSLREYEQLDRRVDFIFSTVPLMNSAVPVFIVNAILTDADKAHLRNQLAPFLGNECADAAIPSAKDIIELVKKHADLINEVDLCEDIQRYLTASRMTVSKQHQATLEDLLSRSRVVLGQEVTSWQAAIEMAAAPLVREGCITADYVKAMVNKVIEFGPYIVIAPGVAIGHARPEDGVTRTSMSLLTIRRGVSFSQQSKHQVYLLFVLASVDGNSHLTALSQLTTMFMQQEHVRELAELDDKMKVWNWIQQYSQFT